MIMSDWAVNLVPSCPIVVVFSQITIVSEAVVAILRIAGSLAPDHIISERLYKIRAAGTDELPYLSKITPVPFRCIYPAFRMAHSVPNPYPLGLPPFQLSV